LPEAKPTSKKTTKKSCTPELALVRDASPAATIKVMLSVARMSSAIRPFVLGAVLALGGCAGSEDVTPGAIAAARKRWDQAGIRNYNLEWASSGLSRAHFVVTVRGGQVDSIVSILPNGKSMAVDTHDPKYYGVEGLFMIIGDELAQLRTKTPFGQPKGTRAVLRFKPDPRFGYPRSYRRDVLGTPQALAIDVIRFTPDPELEPAPKTRPGPAS
jgi:hypothetical protein